MYMRFKIISLLGSLILFLVILELVRRKKIKEKYSLLWLFTAFVLLVLSISKELMYKLSTIMGIYTSQSAFFLLAFLFLMLITIQFSIVISNLSERNKMLTQEVALLRLRMEDLEKNYILLNNGKMM